MEKKGAALAAEWGLPGATATAEQLRALPADMVSVKLTGPNLSGLVGPFVDGRLLAETPLQSLSAGRFTDVPVIIGFNSDEGAMVDIFDQPLASFFGAYTPEKLAEVRKLYADEATEDRPLARKIFTDAISAAPSRLMARYSAGGQPTFLYLFSYVPENTRAKWTGAPHGGELVYVFDNLGTLPETLQGLGEFTEQDRHMARIVQSCWVSFAKTGVPHCSDAPAWPAYSAEDNELLEFGTEIVVRKGFRKAKLDFQEQNFGRGFAAQE
jgi:para-nitrobenzyl esterase